jgi:hypothetical protein
MKKRNCGPSRVGKVEVSAVIVAVIAELTVQGIVSDWNSCGQKEIFVKVRDGPSAVNVVVDL